MANSFKSTWWIFLLIAAGGIIFFLSYHPNNPQGEQGIVLNDILHQQIVNTQAAEPFTAPAPKTDPVPPMAIITSPVNGHEAGITIQVYSFQDKNRAENALHALKNNGYQAFLIISDLGQKGVWYRVRVGGITDETAAHKMLEEIRKTYNSGFILKPKN
ncbi:MAG: SPOR domain-containing protein [Candidatus Omnitrophica bacterium]|nr:SPOR domain-containing protein [Candidatus Omnitrophota bacterium]